MLAIADCAECDDTGLILVDFDRLLPCPYCQVMTVDAVTEWDDFRGESKRVSSYIQSEALGASARGFKAKQR